MFRQKDVLPFFQSVLFRVGKYLSLRGNKGENITGNTNTIGTGWSFYQPVTGRVEQTALGKEKQFSRISHMERIYGKIIF
jgi:hypothetical protein